ncbi:MAG TPA: sensor histidine kinase [Janthinobacterium sp.]|nr:sensor histidine kinase [Janthinobacterium sp.]
MSFEPEPYAGGAAAPALYLLGGAGLGMALGAVIAVGAGAGWSNAMLLAVPLTLVYAVAAGFSAYYLCRAYPLGGRHPAATLGVMGAAALVAGLLWTVLAHFWNTLCLLPDASWAGVRLTPALSALLFGLGVLLYGLALAVHYLLIEFVRAKTAEQRELESRLMAQEAQLRMLRSQIDPHFLFNSLNSISALTASDPSAARAMTVALADFFRHSLGMEAHTNITLGQEMALVRLFLEIEQVRFGARLAVEESIEAAAAVCLVPPMLIQPLVENAVKHGICGLTGGGTIRIVARRVGSLLRISVSNPVDADLPPPGRHGIGLNNVRQRLAGAHGHGASIAWTRGAHSFDVDMSMPAESGDEAGQVSGETRAPARQGEKQACA